MELRNLGFGKLGAPGGAGSAGRVGTIGIGVAGSGLSGQPGAEAGALGVAGRWSCTRRQNDERVRRGPGRGGCRLGAFLVLCSFVLTRMLQHRSHEEHHEQEDDGENDDDLEQREGTGPAQCG